MKIKIWGLQRSGTNYITELIKINYSHEVLTNNPVWKHCHPRICKGIDKHVAMVKDPYAWLYSYLRYAAIKEVNENIVKTEIERWNMWLALTQKFILQAQEMSVHGSNTDIVVIDYFRLIENPVGVLKEKIGNSVDIRDIEVRVEKGERWTDKQFNKAFWLNNEFRNDMRKKEIDFVNAYADFTTYEKLLSL